MTYSLIRPDLVDQPKYMLTNRLVCLSPNHALPYHIINHRLASSYRRCKVVRKLLRLVQPKRRCRGL